MKKSVSILLLTVTAGALSACYSTDAVKFSALSNQSAMVRDGVPALMSRKARSIVLVSPAGRGVESVGRPVFVVGVTNLTNKPFDFRVADISVSQETSDGIVTALPVIPYEQLATEEKTRQVALALLTGAAVAANSYSAAQAGYGHANGTVYGAGGSASFHASYYDPTAAAIAQSNAAATNEAMIANTVESGRRSMAALEKTVLKDNTIMPGEWVGGQVHITQPVNETGKAKTYNMVIEVAGEKHSIAITQGQTAQ